MRFDINRVLAAVGGLLLLFATAARTADMTDEEFDAAVNEILTFEEDARFTKARRRARRLQRKLRRAERKERLRMIVDRVTEEEEVAIDLGFAVEQLTAANARSRSVARKQLQDAGAAGRILLRKALRTGDKKTQWEAAQLLAAQADSKAIPAILALALKTPETAKAQELIRSLRPAAGDLSAEQVAKLYAPVAEDRTFRLRESVGLLGAVLRDACDGDREKFNALANDPQAHAVLKAYVQRAMVAATAEVRNWAAADGLAFDPMVTGLRGSYYAGKSFDKLVHEQCDAKIQVAQRKFPYPDNRQDDISVRWTGFVVIEKPGKYTFYSASDDGQRLWVGKTQLIDDWADHGVTEKSGTIELQPGLHPFKVEYYQGGGGAAITVSWRGPGFKKEVLAGRHLRTHPWPKMEKHTN